jgi:solute carrier family 35 protein C2
MYNKWMFSAEYYGFTYPLFVTACHMVVQWFCAGMIRWTVPRFRPVERPTRREYM